MRSYFIHTFGCQANKSDSERIAGDYESRGFVEAKSWRNCSALIVNTCAIRKRAEDRAKGFLLNVVTYFAEQKLPKPKIILTGCILHHGEAGVREFLPMIDEILPVNEVGFNNAAVRKDKIHAWVPISQGCNSFCTFCIVPYSRGREKSRSFDEIMTEVQSLVERGYTEITLLGQNVNSWGLEKMGIGLRKLLMDRSNLTRDDIPDNLSQYVTPTGVPPFVKLLRAVTALPQIKIVRFISSNPWDFHDALIDEVGKNKKIDRYVHLPIQSGSNSVLYRMNRGYTVESYREIVKKLHQADPAIVVGTDIIVGFADETDEEFEETRKLAVEMDWKVGFVAMYSPRPGTAAAKLYPDTIPHAVKKKRWEILDQIVNKDNLSVRPKVI